MVRWLIANTFFSKEMPGRVVLNNDIVPIDSIGQLPGHDWLFVITKDASAGRVSQGNHFLTDWLLRHRNTELTTNIPQACSAELTTWIAGAARKPLRINPLNRVGGILLQIQAAGKADGVVRDKSSCRRVVVSVSIQVQPRFRVMLLPLKPKRASRCNLS